MKKKLYKKIIFMLARMKVKQMQREKDKSGSGSKKTADDNTSDGTKLNTTVQDGAGTDELEIIDLNVEPAGNEKASASNQTDGENTAAGDDTVAENQQIQAAKPRELTSEERLDMLLKGMMPQPQPELKPVEAVEPVVTVKSVETTESFEKIEPVNTTEPVDKVDSVDTVDSVETMKSIGKVEKEPEVSVQPTQEQLENEISKIQNNSVTSGTVQDEKYSDGDEKNNADIVNDKSIMTDDVNKYSEELGIKELRQELRRVKYNTKFAATLYNTVGTLIVVAALAILVANLWLPVLQVTGTSMSPTLEEGQVLVASKGSSFKTGDVVAFYYNNKILVKRVIAMPGDWVNISDDGTVYVNDIAIDEPYLKEKALGDCNIELPYQVPESKIFVMGDNRSVSLDSRNTAIGCISEEQVVGKVSFGLWPLSKFGSID